MTVPAPIHCPSCGTPVGSAAGRCPQCGATLGALPELPSVSPLAPSLRVRRAESAAQNTRRVLLLAGMVVGAGIVVTALLVVRPGSSPASASASAAPPPAPAAPSVDVEVKHQASPTDSYPRAKSRAATWHKDAALLAINAQPVKNGFVDLTGAGFMEFVFGKPEGSQLPGETTESKQYVVRMDASGTHASERTSAGARVAGEPACTFFDAWTKAIASGVSKARTLSVEYGYSPPLKRSIWTFTSESPDAADGSLKTRLDGFDCAILLR